MQDKHGYTEWLYRVAGDSITNYRGQLINQAITENVF